MNTFDTNRLYFKNSDNILYILTRYPEQYLFKDVIYDSSGDIRIYTSYINNSIKLLGIDIKNKNDCLYYYNPSMIFSYNKDNYSIIRFVNIDDDYLLECTVETPIEGMPLYIYKDQYNKLIQIVLYENENCKDIDVIR